MVPKCDNVKTERLGSPLVASADKYLSLHEEQHISSGRVSHFHTFSVMVVFMQLTHLRRQNLLRALPLSIR